MMISRLKKVGYVVAGLGVLLLVMVPTAAFAQTTYPAVPTTPTIGNPCAPVVTSLCNVSVGSNTAQATSTSPSGSLPFTGGNIALLVGVGLVVVVMGVVLVRLARRPSLDT
jgi:hypothetical protein